MPVDRRLSRRHILEAIDASLRRLGTDYLDLYQARSFDPLTPLEETVRAFDAWHLMKALGIARALGAEPFAALQAQYSLVCRDIEREHVPLCLEEGVALLPWSPLGAGMLTGKVRRGRPAPADSRAAVDVRNRDRFRSERNLDLVEVLVGVAEDLGRTPSQVALAWATDRPAVSSVIFGARTLEQIEDNLGAADLKLPEEARRRLDDVSRLPWAYPYDYRETLRANILPEALAR